MTILDRLDEPTTTDEPEVATPGALRAAVVGLVTGAASLAVPVLVAATAWILDERSTGTLGPALGVGAAWWLLGQGVSLTGALTISLVPLGLTVLTVIAGWFGLREGLRGVSASGPVWAGLLRAPLAAAIGAWWGGYAVAVALAALLSTLGPLTPVWHLLPLAMLLVPGIAVIAVLTALGRDEPHVLGPRLALSWVPVTVRRAAGPALRTTRAALLVGMALAVAVAALGFSGVQHVHAAVGAGTFGAVVLSALQALALPNLGLWALSFAAGPGFQVAEGATTTWSGSRSGLMPLIPILGGLPQPGAFPWFTAMVVLIPLGLGVYAGRCALRSVARLSSVRTKVAVAATTGLGAAGLLTVTDLLGGGALGESQLAHIGVPAGWLSLALAGELVVGAVARALWDAWRLRR